MFFKKDNEYYSCEQLEYGINFDVKGLYHCSAYMEANKNEEPVVKAGANINENYAEFLKLKSILKSNARKGRIPERCKNCFQLKKQHWIQSKKINKITVFANKTCNLNCLYCISHTDKKYYNSLPDAPVYPYISHLINDNLIAENSNILFAGGEPVMHFEFEKVMRLIMDKLVNPFIRINTSGAIYSESIASAIEKGISNVVISLDSGNKDLYTSIKNADEFDTVIKNVSKYIRIQETSCNLNQIFLKYIIIPGINDKEAFIIEFFELVKQLNCKVVCCDIEYFWAELNKNNSDKLKDLRELINFFRTKAREYNLKCL